MFYRFPVHNKTEWIRAIKVLNMQTIVPKKHTVVCSKHFEPKYLVPANRGLQLLPGAIPTLFPSYGNENFEDIEFLIESDSGGDSASCTTESASKRRRRSFVRYPGDVNSTTVSPTTSRKALRICRTALFKKEIQLKQLSRKIKRKSINIKTMRSLILELKKKTLICENTAAMLNSVVSSNFLMKNLVFGKNQGKYDEEIRTFAVTLHFYSPRAYNFVRDKFAKKLPHPRTIREWYKSIDGSPGFTTLSLDLIRKKVIEAQGQGKKIFLALMMDEMAIRQSVEWDNSKNKFYGYVDVGGNLENSDERPRAKEALTFLVNCVNDRWKVLVGYFLINGITAKEKAEVVRQMLSYLSDTGAEVVSLTFDGAPSNISMANNLGANLNISNLKVSFFSQYFSNEIVIFLDICHMIKLVRNLFASRPFLLDKDYNKVEWKYISELEQIQKKEGLSLAPKLTKKHIQWYEAKMKVKLATQTLSNSVAVAIKYLQKTNVNFKNSIPTIKFIEIFDRLFDVFNSINFSKQGLKKPLCDSNFNSVMAFFQEAEVYIRELKLEDGTSVLTSKNKTGLIGFLVAIQSVKNLFSRLIKASPPSLNFLCMYKFSQDHLEVEFSKIRSRGGFNNNPSAKMFEVAYKRLILHDEIKISKNANIIEITSDIVKPGSGNLFSDKINYKFNQNSDIQVIEEEVEVMYEPLSEFSQNILGYIAGFIQKKLLKQIKCPKCIVSISRNNTFNELIHLKNFGRLIYPNNNIVAVTKIAETSFRVVKACNHFSSEYFYQNILNHAMNNMNNTIFEDLVDHTFDIFENHRIYLIKAIIIEYLRIRLHHLAKHTSLSFHNKYIRQHLTKTIHFSGL